MQVDPPEALATTKNSGGTNTANTNNSSAPMDIDPIDDGPRVLLQQQPQQPPQQPPLATARPFMTAVRTMDEARQAIEVLLHNRNNNGATATATPATEHDVAARVAAAHCLDSVAEQLGPERARNELIPFVTDGIDEDDEVLLAMAKSLGRMVDAVGGPTEASCLLPPLEILLTVEEATVREAAAQAVGTVAAALDQAVFQSAYWKMLTRLAQAEWFTARMSAAALLPGALERLTTATLQQECLDLFGALCHDDTPMVRRIAAQSLGKMAKQLVAAKGREEAMAEQGPVLKVLLPLYRELAASEQPDSVRLQTTENCVALGRVLTQNDSPPTPTEQQVLQALIPLLVATIDDRSWRVRWTAAHKFDQVMQAFYSIHNNTSTTTSILDALVPAYEKLLQDPEAEVRTAATLNLARVAAIPATVPQQSAPLNRQDGAHDEAAAAIQEQQQRNGPRVSVAERLVQRVTHLTEDDSEHVRAALAQVATGLAPILGRDATINYLVPPVLLLLRDAAAEVRLHLIGSLSALHPVIGVDLLSQSLLPAILDLAQDGAWRIRYAMMEDLPTVAQHLGREFFTERLAVLAVSWLTDDIAAVRKASTRTLADLAHVFGGDDWAVQVLLPPLEEIAQHASYLKRLTAVQAYAALGREFSPEAVRRELLPRVSMAATDPVPNVRFHAAQSLQTLAVSVGPETTFTWIRPVVQHLIQDDDDREVRHVATLVLRELDRLADQKVPAAPESLES